MIPQVCYQHYYPPGVRPVQGEFSTLMAVQDSRDDTLIEDILPLFKSHARIIWNLDDELCKMYLESAISRIEQYVNMPIRAATYSYSIPTEWQTFEQYELPLRNCNTVGQWYGAEALIAPKIVPAPVTWPMTLEVGFIDGASVPSDLKSSIFALATALYELRSNPEQVDIYISTVMAGSLSRYWVARC